MWLRKLQERLDAVNLKGLTGPKAPVAESEQVLGEANDEAKRLWAMLTTLHREARGVMADFASKHILAEDHDDVACAAANKRMGELNREVKLLDDMLRFSLGNQFSDDESSIVGIRDGWQVVKLAEVDSRGQNINGLPQGLQDVIRELSRVLGVDLGSGRDRGPEGRDPGGLHARDRGICRGFQDPLPRPPLTRRSTIRTPLSTSVREGGVFVLTKGDIFLYFTYDLHRNTNSWRADH